MSSKILFLLFLVSSCGVKGDPTAPKNGPVHSLIENYPDIKPSKPLDDRKPVGGRRRQ